MIPKAQHPKHLIEVKQSDATLSKQFGHFSNFLPDVEKVQLVKNLTRESSTAEGVKIKSLVKWLSTVTL